MYLDVPASMMIEKKMLTNLTTTSFPFHILCSQYFHIQRTFSLPVQIIIVIELGQHTVT